MTLPSLITQFKKKETAVVQSALQRLPWLLEYLRAIHCEINLWRCLAQNSRPQLACVGANVIRKWPWRSAMHKGWTDVRARLKRDDTCAETRFGLSEKWTSPFKSAGDSVQSTTGSRGVRISGQTMDRPCSEVQYQVVATLSNRLFPLHFPSQSSPCAITFRTACSGGGIKNSEIDGVCVSNYLLTYLLTP